MFLVKLSKLVHQIRNIPLINWVILLLSSTKWILSNSPYIDLPANNTAESFFVDLSELQAASNNNFRKGKSQNRAVKSVKRRHADKTKTLPRHRVEICGKSLTSESHSDRSQNGPQNYSVLNAVVYMNNGPIQARNFPQRLSSGCL